MNHVALILQIDYEKGNVIIVVYGTSSSNKVKTAPFYTQPNFDCISLHEYLQDPNHVVHEAQNEVSENNESFSFY